MSPRSSTLDIKEKTINQDLLQGPILPVLPKERPIRPEANYQQWLSGTITQVRPPCRLNDLHLTWSLEITPSC